MKKGEDLLLLATKLMKVIPDVSNAKEYYKSFLKNSNNKMIKQTKGITQQPKTIKKPNIIDIKSETSCKLSKTISQAKKISQVGGAG